MLVSFHCDRADYLRFSLGSRGKYSFKITHCCFLWIFAMFQTKRELGSSWGRKAYWIEWMDRCAILSNSHIVYEPAVHLTNPYMLCGPNSNPVLFSFRTWRIGLSCGGLKISPVIYYNCFLIMVIVSRPFLKCVGQYLWEISAIVRKFAHYVTGCDYWSIVQDRTISQYQKPYKIVYLSQND